jgi:hypothetical protein
MKQVSKSLGAPKPDTLFGSYLNRGTLMTHIYGTGRPGIFSIDHQLVKHLSPVELSEVACGALGEQFCFPLFVVERKSDSGALFHAQNQLLGSLSCMYEAQAIVQRKFDKNLPAIALGIVNVGNWVELWGCWRAAEVLPHSLTLTRRRDTWMHGTSKTSTSSVSADALSSSRFPSTCDNGLKTTKHN